MEYVYLGIHYWFEQDPDDNWFEEDEVIGVFTSREKAIEYIKEELIAKNGMIILEETTLDYCHVTEIDACEPDADPTDEYDIHVFNIKQHRVQ